MSNVVYKLGITEQSATVTDFGANFTGGEQRWENGNKYRLVNAGEAVNAGRAVIFDEADSATNNYITVTLPDGATAISGMNDTGSNITSGNWFWMLVEGQAQNAYTGSGVTNGDSIEVDTSGEFETQSGGVIVGYACETIAGTGTGKILVTGTGAGDSQ